MNEFLKIIAKGLLWLIGIIIGTFACALTFWTLGKLFDAWLLVK